MVHFHKCAAALAILNKLLLDSSLNSLSSVSERHLRKNWNWQNFGRDAVD